MSNSIKPTSETLRAALNAIQDVPVLVVGDIMLDRYVWGSVDRISPEAPVPVVQVKRMEDRLGGAGNVVRNLRSIGARVALAGYVGKDDEARGVTDLLTSNGVDCQGVMVDASRPTTVKTRVIAQHQQIVRIDREQIPSEDSPLGDALEDKLAAWVEKTIPKYSAVILSDYGKGVVSRKLLAAFEKVRPSGALKVGKIPLIVDPHPAHYSIYKGMSVAKPNRKEAELATGIRIKDRASATSAARVLLDRWQAEMMLISLGEDGLIIAQASGEPEIFLETVAREVSDVSGAGDTVTAVFSAALASGATPSVAGALANIAAGIVVSEVGTVPVDLAKLRAEIERLH